MVCLVTTGDLRTANEMYDGQEAGGVILPVIGSTTLWSVAPRILRQVVVQNL